MTGQMKYYEMHDNKYIPGRWHVRMPLHEDAEGREEWFDIWQFTEGRVLEIERPLRLSVKPAGVALEYTKSVGIPIVHRRIVLLFERLGLHKEVQFISVEVEGQTEPWFILNTLRVIQCIDDTRSKEVFYWQPEDGRPEKLGGYKNVRGLKVDPAKVGDTHIFRPWGWKVVLIVSEYVKQAMEAEGITGIRFIEA